MSSHLFLSLPIGALFFRDPFNPNENPSIKVDDTHARNPKGAVVEVNGGVLVFTGFTSPTTVSDKAYIALIVERVPVPAYNEPGLLDDSPFFDSLETSLEIR